MAINTRTIDWQVVGDEQVMRPHAAAAELIAMAQRLDLLQFFERAPKGQRLPGLRRSGRLASWESHSASGDGKICRLKPVANFF